jgi:serine/threonine protein kinase
MHSLGIIHKDIKCDNILLESLSHGFRAVIIDFGTTVSEKSKDVGNFSGSPIFMSPEILAYLANNRRSLKRLFLDAPITKAVDIWGFGHVIYQIVAGGRELFQERKIGRSTKSSQNFKPCTGPATITYSTKEKFSKDYLLESCLKSQKKTKSGIKDENIRDRLLDIASSCLRKNYENRPSITWVFDQLQELKEATS